MDSSPNPDNRRGKWTRRLRRWAVARLTEPPGLPIYELFVGLLILVGIAILVLAAARHLLLAL